MAQTQNGGWHSRGGLPHKNLEAVLEQYFADSMLGACQVPTMVTSYDIQNRETVFLKSWLHQYSGVLCRDAARATSAAPTYFEPKPLTRPICNTYWLMAVFL